MGELQQLRAALFDLTEQIRGLRADLQTPTNQLDSQWSHIQDLIEAIEKLPEEITMKLEEETMTTLEEHTSAVNNYMADR